MNAIRISFAMLACALSFGAMAAQPRFDVRAISLTGAEGSITLDYFAWDPGSHRLWVPAGNAESVIAIDGPSGKLTTIKGYASAEFAARNRTVRLGPSSATVGDGVVFVGNRADSSISSINSTTLERGPSYRVAPASAGRGAAPDGISYAAPTKELWITRGQPAGALLILDAADPKALREKAAVSLGGGAEGYAVDEAKGLFYTNDREGGDTVAVSLREHKVVSRWKSGCDDPRGLALDVARGFVFAACQGRVVAMDAKHGGSVVGSIDTGEGLDNIDYSPSRRWLFAAAGKAGTLTIARVEDSGALTRIDVIPTAPGARAVVAGDDGVAYVADPAKGRILVVTPRPEN